MLALGILLAHLVGDYVFQSHWMASRKTSAWWPAIAHGLAYTVPYALVTQSTLALAVIASTHILIDRFRLARHVTWLKNLMGPAADRARWSEAKTNGGYPASTPAWLSTWLMIITDNTLHLLINTAAVVWL